MNELMTKRAKAHDAQTALVALSEAEDRDLSAEEQTTFDALDAEIAGLDKRIVRLQGLAARDESLEAVGERLTADTPALDHGVRNVRERLMDDQSGGFKSVGQFAASVYQAGLPLATVDERISILQAAATGQNAASGPDGGFLMPKQFSDSIFEDQMLDSESFLSMTDNYPVDGESLTLNAIAQTSRATGSRWGAARAYWISEADQATNSKVQFRQIKLEPQEMAVMIPATNKMLRNSGALTTIINRAGRSEIDFLIGDAIIEGTGVGQPTGIVGHSATVSVAKQGGQVAATLVKQNIDKMWARFPANRRAKAVWLINQDCEPALEELSAVVGTGGLPIYLPAGGIVDAPNARLKGRPVKVVEYCSTLGTVGDIILVDLSAYAVGLQTGGVEEAVSIHLRFDYAETMFRLMWGMDGQPWLKSPLTPFKGTSNTTSPYVTLDTRA